VRHLVAIMLFLSKTLLAASPVLVLVLLVTTPPLAMIMSSTNPIFVGSNNAYAQSNPGDQPTFFIYINPGETDDAEAQYSAKNVAVPLDTTVKWVNNDQGKQHTITSGMPGNNSGFFDSGPIRFNDEYQLTFNTANGLVGEFPYYDTLNPEVTGKISANDTVIEGQSFQFKSGTGPTLDLSENNRTLVAFTPKGMSVIQPQTMYYNLSIMRDSDNQTLFSNQFEVANNDFEIELLQAPNISNFITAGPNEMITTGNNTSIWFGPDVSSDYTGAYHLAGDFFSQPGNYTLGVEMVKIGADPPPQPMKDDFSMSVVS
jgi:plastocyanin